MSREIKFRAWDKKNGYYADYEDIEEEITAQAIDGWRSKDGGTSFTLDYGIKQFELEQYTGLTDKNGKEIYEGDIVRLYGHYVSAITWQDNYCGFRWYNEEDGYCGLGKDNEEYYEVIGKIHENPELLEDK